MVSEIHELIFKLQFSISLRSTLMSQAFLSSICFIKFLKQNANRAQSGSEIRKTIQFFMECLACFCFVTLRVLNWLVHKILFSMSELAFLSIIARAGGLKVFTHFCLIFSFIGFRFHCLIRRITRAVS
uniref:mRNA containing open reading frame n=1 Tax=Tetrahymena thermophila TaxID=5911 RepID=Q94826_TETTH|nr:unnamed protein product [Tetrahymena thermophila]